MTSRIQLAFRTCRRGRLGHTGRALAGIIRAMESQIIEIGLTEWQVDNPNQEWITALEAAPGIDDYEP